VYYKNDVCVKWLITVADGGLKSGNCVQAG